MIKVNRISPEYWAAQFNGNCDDLTREISSLGVVCSVTIHTRLGDKEALYAMVEIEGHHSPIFVQKTEWILFNETSKSYICTSSDYAFKYSFSEIVDAEA